MKRALVVFSGGLDTTVCVPLMREEGFDSILTVTVDVGQPREDVDRAESRAERLRTEHLTLDAVDRFASEFCTEAIRFNADYQGYPLSTAIARPLIGELAGEVAVERGIETIVHGCTGKGNDQFRIEHALRSFAPDAKVLAPIRDRDLTRSWEMRYAKSVGAPVEEAPAAPWSIDENLWGRSIEGGALEDPSLAPSDGIYDWTTDPLATPNEPTDVTVRFEAGRPVALDSAELEPAELIRQANRLAGAQGVGRIEMMEDRVVGLKARENYECPGATLLITAHRALEGLVLTKAERDFKRSVEAEWAEMAYRGLWWHPGMDALRGYVNSQSERCTGWVRVRLFKGSCRAIARSSPWALYDAEVASFDDSEALPQSQMAGMVRTHGMDSELYARLKRQR